jgi:hypothetical protein
MALESRDELEQVWREVAAAIPEPWELGGVTYHGPSHPGPWIAFVFNRAQGATGGPEGVGSTAVAALRDLRARIEQSDAGAW